MCISVAVGMITVWRMSVGVVGSKSVDMNANKLSLMDVMASILEYIAFIENIPVCNIHNF